MAETRGGRFVSMFFGWWIPEGCSLWHNSLPFPLLGLCLLANLPHLIGIVVGECRIWRRNIEEEQGQEEKRERTEIG